jgi:hypothetical protein
MYKKEIVSMTEVRNSHIWLITSDADPEAGAFLTSGSGIKNRFLPDLG